MYCRGGRYTIVTFVTTQLISRARRPHTTLLRGLFVHLEPAPGLASFRGFLACQPQVTRSFVGVSGRLVAVRGFVEVARRVRLRVWPSDSSGPALRCTEPLRRSRQMPVEERPSPARPLAISLTRAPTGAAREASHGPDRSDAQGTRRRCGSSTAYGGWSTSSCRFDAVLMSAFIYFTGGSTGRQG